MINLASIPAIDKTLTLVKVALASSVNGMVFVTTISLIHDFSIFSAAFDENTGWTIAQRISLAPLRFKSSQHATKLPAVSQISSATIAILPSTSPITLVASATFGFDVFYQQ